ncbi:MAG: hypothetical protein HWD61_02790 [Parachlamydiaceae bacterium]|nr:MAG: hypothetical protein HWD61_02790 [Parachlamydiaceae bacterium]
MELNEIIALKEINLEKESLNEKGSITSKPSIWYLIGRTILWVITCGHAKINPKLHAGLNKVIVSTENILKKPEQLQENAAKDLSAALEKLKTIKKISLSQQNDLVHLIQEIKNQTLAKGETKSNNLDPVQKPGPQIDITIKSATSVDETPKTQNSQAVYELPKDRTEFIRQVANGTIPDRKTFCSKSLLSILRSNFIRVRLTVLQNWQMRLVLNVKEQKCLFYLSIGFGSIILI